MREPKRHVLVTTVFRDRAQKNAKPRIFREVHVWGKRRMGEVFEPEEKARLLGGDPVLMKSMLCDIEYVDLIAFLEKRRDW